MGLVTDIIGTYRAPRAVVRRRIGPDAAEPRALVTLILGCGLVFVAQAPRLARIAFETGEDLQMLMGGALFAWLFIMPLVLYALAGALGLALKLAGGQGGYPVRMATFWALLAAAPLWLLWGLTAGFVGPGAATSVTGTAAFGAFVIFWGLGLSEAAFPRDNKDL